MFNKQVLEAIAVLDQRIDGLSERVYANKYATSGAEQRLGKRLYELTTSNEALAKRLLCMEDYGGHDWVFVDRELSDTVYIIFSSPYVTDGDPRYKFKCKRCGHTRLFEWGELSKEEQDALTAIGLEG